MYSKVYWLSCDPSKQKEVFEYYDNVIIPGIQDAGQHEEIAHQVIEAEDGKWLLVANYKNKAMADAYVPAVKEFIRPLIESFGASLEIITEGNVHRYVEG